MLKDLKRITIFTGHYGSGKTELAINYTLKLAQTNKKVAIVDLDIVNPYFRSREVKAELEAKGIRVITPTGILYHADLPTISPEILGVLQNEDTYVVFDVGGDDAGATALGRFIKYFTKETTDMYFVVNSFRPFTKDAEGVIKILREVEIASRLSVTGLVSNGNLSYETTAAVIREGYKVTDEVANQLGLPIVFVGVQQELAKTIEELKAPILPLKIFMLLPWLDIDKDKILTDPNSRFKQFNN